MAERTLTGWRETMVGVANCGPILSVTVETTNEPELEDERAVTAAQGLAGVAVMAIRRARRASACPEHEWAPFGVADEPDAFCTRCGGRRSELERREPPRCSECGLDLTLTPELLRALGRFGNPLRRPPCLETADGLHRYHGSPQEPQGASASAPDGPGLPRGVPGYWRDETSGVLEPVVRAYLVGAELGPREVDLMRAYLRQWIRAAGFGGLEVAALRASVETIRSTEDVRAWLRLAMDTGIDPL